MQQEGFYELPATTPEIDDEEQLYVRPRPVSKHALYDVAEKGMQIYNWVDGLLFGSNASGMDELLAKNSPLLSCHHENGFVALVQKNVLSVLRITHELVQDASSIKPLVLNKHHSQGKIVDIAWSFDQQCSLLVSSTKGLYYSTFPDESSQLASEYHHIIDTQWIAYPTGIVYVTHLSPSPLGRYVLCMGIARDHKTRYLMLADTAFHSWQFLSLSTGIAGALTGSNWWTFPSQVYESSCRGQRLEEQVVQLKWIDGGERVAVTLANSSATQSLLILDTYQWTRQSVVINQSSSALMMSSVDPTAALASSDNAPSTASSTVEDTRTIIVADHILVSYPVASTGLSTGTSSLQLTALCMEPLLYLDGTSISAVRSVKPAFAIAHRQLLQSTSSSSSASTSSGSLRMAIQRVQPSACGTFLLVFYTAFSPLGDNTAQDTSDNTTATKYKALEYPCLDVYAVIDNTKDGTAPNNQSNAHVLKETGVAFEYRCTVFRHGTHRQQLVVESLEAWPHPVTCTIGTFETPHNNLLAQTTQSSSWRDGLNQHQSDGHRMQKKSNHSVVVVWSDEATTIHAI